MQSSQQEGIEVQPQEVLQQMIQQQIILNQDDSSIKQAAQNVQKIQKQQLLMVDTLGQLHHYVGPENIPELEAIHAGAPATAAIYVSSVLIIYLIGLVIIFIHHMNTAYGPWAWGLADARDELRPLWSWAGNKREDNSSASPRRGATVTANRDKKKKKKTRFANEYEEDEFQDEVITPRTASCPQQTSAIIHFQESANGNADIITSASDPGPGPVGLHHSSLRHSFVQRLQNGYSKFRPASVNGLSTRQVLDLRDQTDENSLEQSNRLTNCSAFTSIASHDQSPPPNRNDKSDDSSN